MRHVNPCSDGWVAVVKFEDRSSIGTNMVAIGIGEKSIDGPFDIVGINNTVGRIERRNLGFVFMSIDPERDTVEQVFNKSFGFDTSMRRLNVPSMHRMLKLKVLRTILVW
ncbi:hypothetical protein BC332_23823 [Capsicum chinense]|nr:hypothetical protein BC332_23823 [Capsicum chinense]